MAQENNITDTIKVGIILPQPITSYILGIGLGCGYDGEITPVFGLGGFVEYGTDKPFLQDELSEFYYNGSTYPKCNEVIWIDSEQPKQATRIHDVTGVNIMIKSTNDYLYTSVKIPDEYADISGKNAEYVFRIKWDGNGVSAIFDTDLSSII